MVPKGARGRREGHKANLTIWPLFHIDAQKDHFSRFEPSIFILYRTLIALKLHKTIFPDDFDPSTHFQSSTSEWWLKLKTAKMPFLAFNFLGFRTSPREVPGRLWGSQGARGSEPPKTDLFLGYVLRSEFAEKKICSFNFCLKVVSARQIRLLT